MHNNADKQLKKQIAAQIRKHEREISKQEKIYNEAAGALPMALDPAFCQRAMNASQRAMADLRKAIDELKKVAGGGMRLVAEFWHTLTTPEEWSTGSIIAVGIAGMLCLSILAGEAFDVQVLGM